MKPKITCDGYYDVKKLSLDDALNLCVLKNEYGMVAYDNDKNLAYFYPPGIKIVLENNTSFDTFVQNL